MTADTNPQCEPTDAAPAKPCCKCEAYREIQLESAREIARLRDLLKEAGTYAEWIQARAKKAEKP